jgi:hypothetical protein
MVTIDGPSHPQVIFVGFEDDDPGLAAMRAVVPSWRVGLDGLEDLRSVEWDIFVCKEAGADVPVHMHVLAFNTPQPGTALVDGDACHLSRKNSPLSSALDVAPDFTDEGLRRLVMSELVPWLRTQERFLHLQATHYMSYATGLLPQSADSSWSVRDADGYMLAGDFARTHGSARGWYLPFTPARPEQWLLAAMRDWHERTPDMVPAMPDWRSRPPWQTAPEVKAQTELLEFESRRNLTIDRLNAEELQVLAAIDQASVAANNGLRRLLTSQSDNLVDAVKDALTVLGFTVDDMDAQIEPGTAKLEDLQVHDPTDTSWSNITEVKGYSNGGARTADLAFERFARAFAIKTGAYPDSRWYVINQMFNADPDERPAPFAGGATDVAMFAELGGLVIDTRELFKLVSAVEAGELLPHRARESLRGATGVFKFVGSPPAA